MKRDDTYRLSVIKKLGADLLRYLQENDIDVAEIVSNQVVQWTITTPLYNIGEQVYNLSGELKAAHPEIPWHRISGMRHRLVHDYEDTNWSIVAEAVMNDVPLFLGQVAEIQIEDD